MSVMYSCGNINTENTKKNQTTSSTNKINVDTKNSCNYLGRELPSEVFSFNSDNEAKLALTNIMKETGLPANFELKAADVDNALATIFNNKRYILYNQKFMEEVKKNTNTNFAEISILAHEIGHHLSGHTLSEVNSRQDLELEADRFSGFILNKMGATLNESCITMEIFGSEESSETHPNKNARIAAITNGWKEGEEIKTNRKEIILTPEIHNNSKYIVDVVGVDKYITIRNRNLSPQEFTLGNSGTEEGNNLNRETVITNLNNGTEIDILSSINCTYYVRAYTEKGEILGYIVKRFSGKPTVSIKN